MSVSLKTPEEEEKGRMNVITKPATAILVFIGAAIVTIAAVTTAAPPRREVSSGGQERQASTPTKQSSDASGSATRSLTAKRGVQSFQSTAAGGGVDKKRGLKRADKFGVFRVASEAEASVVKDKRAALDNAFDHSVIPLGDTRCGPECIFCHFGTSDENACDLDWEFDGTCDCGCQFNDALDCNIADPRCGPECDFCHFGTSDEGDCPLTWQNDQDCDCGCQFDDAVDCGTTSTPGACCNPNLSDPACVDDVTQNECLEANGGFGGAGTSCPSGCPCDDDSRPCDWCWTGTAREGNCDPAWELDRSCDCGCPFSDEVDCNGDPRCSPVCDYCWWGIDSPEGGQNNCDPGWEKDGYCDCGCQFDDADDCDPNPMPGACCNPDLNNPACANGVTHNECLVDFERGFGGEETGCSSGCPCEDDSRPCRWCWAGTTVEGRCDSGWEGDGECDCGCQFSDAADCGVVSISLVNTFPPNCAIEARQNSKPEGEDEGLLCQQRWKSFDLIFDGDTSSLTTNDFFARYISEVRGGLSISNLISNGNTLTLEFAGPIPPGSWLCIDYLADPTTVCWGSLPGDVSSDGTDGPLDILRVIDCLNHVPGVDCELWQCDVDCSGRCAPTDILRVIDLLNGAGVYPVMNGATLIACPSGLE